MTSSRITLRLTNWALIAAICLSASAARAQSAQATLSCPATVPSGGTFMVSLNITLTPTTIVLGAYQVEVHNLVQQVKITSVNPGTSTSLRNPNADANSFNTATTIINDFQTNLNQPTGTVNVAVVTFSVPAAAGTSSTIGLRVNNIFVHKDGDPNSLDIGGMATGCNVLVGHPNND